LRGEERTFMDARGVTKLGVTAGQLHSGVGRLSPNPVELGDQKKWGARPTARARAVFVELETRAQRDSLGARSMANR
jgi:hypothetical protein